MEKLEYRKGFYWRLSRATPKSQKTRARIEARNIMIKAFPNLPKDFWYTHSVHHKDGNPLNNTPENLEIVSPYLHLVYHKGGWKCLSCDIINWGHRCSFCNRRKSQLERFGLYEKVKEVLTCQKEEFLSDRGS